MQGFRRLISDLRTGDELRLVREKDNGYDRYAVAVCRMSGERIGYIPRKDNRVISNLLDGDQDVYALTGRIDDRDVELLIMMRTKERAVRRHFRYNWSERTCVADPEPVRRPDDLIAIPDGSAEVAYHRDLTEDRIWDLRWGSPIQDDVHWMFFMEGDTVYICRSQTSVCIYAIELSSTGDHRLRINSDRDLYRMGDPEDEVRCVDRLLDEWLDCDVRLPAETARLGVCGNIIFINEVPAERWYLDENGALTIERAAGSRPRSQNAAERRISLPLLQFYERKFYGYKIYKR